MSEMVERVAQAIAGALKQAYWEREEPTDDDHLAAARAAIEAMREPTEAMWAKGTGARLDESPSTHKVWREMIDEALRNPRL